MTIASLSLNRNGLKRHRLRDFRARSVYAPLKSQRTKKAKVMVVFNFVLVSLVAIIRTTLPLKRVCNHGFQQQPPLAIE